MNKYLSLLSHILIILNIIIFIQCYYSFVSSILITKRYDRKYNMLFSRKYIVRCKYGSITRINMIYQKLSSSSSILRYAKSRCTTLLNYVSDNNDIGSSSSGNVNDYNVINSNDVDNSITDIDSDDSLTSNDIDINSNSNLHYHYHRTQQRKRVLEHIVLDVLEPLRLELIVFNDTKSTLLNLIKYGDNYLIRRSRRIVGILDDDSSTKSSDIKSSDDHDINHSRISNNNNDYDKVMGCLSNVYIKTSITKPSSSDNYYDNNNDDVYDGYNSVNIRNSSNRSDSAVGNCRNASSSSSSSDDDDDMMSKQYLEIDGYADSRVSQGMLALLIQVRDDSNDVNRFYLISIIIVIIMTMIHITISIILLLIPIHIHNLLIFTFILIHIYGL